MNIKKIDDLHQAARLIELDGIEAVSSATDLIGEEVAMALVVAHLRRAYGSTTSHRPMREIEAEVNEALSLDHLVTQS